jgi:PKD repeat protein
MVLELLACVLLTGVAVSSAAAGDWEWVRPRPTGVDLLDVEYLGGQWIAVGKLGTILTSPDGFAWTSRTSGTTENLGAIAWNGSVYVVGGDNGIVLNSPDGVTWIAAAVPAGPGGAVKVLDVAWVGTQFVGLGGVGWNNPDTFPLLSPDGSSWVVGDTDLGSVKKLASDGTTIVAVGSSIALSTDGSVWLPSTNPPTGEYPNYSDVIYASGRWVAVGWSNGRAAITSTNGNDWTRTFVQSPQIPTAVGWNGTSFAVGCYWECGLLVGDATATSWHVAQSVMGLVQINGIAGNAGVFVAIGNGGKILVSDGGEAWVDVSIGTTRALSAVTRNDTTYVAVGRAGTVLTSPDARYWTPRDSKTSNDLRCIAFGNGNYVAGVADGKVITSPDGVDWTQADSGLFEVRDVMWNGSFFLAVGRPGIVTSANGFDWVPADAPDGKDLFGVAWDGSKYLAVGINGTAGDVLSSPTGSVWTQEAGPSSALLDVVWTGTLFVAVGNDDLDDSKGALWNSNNGSSWSRATLPWGTKGLYSVASKEGGETYAVGVGGTGVVSTDGVAWTGSNYSWPNQALTGVVWGFGEFVMIGGAVPAVGNAGERPFMGTKRPGAVPRATWDWEMNRQLRSVALGGTPSRVVAVGELTALISSNASSWVPVSIGTRAQLWSVAWRGGTFVAVGTDLKAGGGGLALVAATSATGESWSRHEIAASSGWDDTLNSVVSNGSLFVAVGSGGKVFTSPDGDQWTARASGTEDDLTSIAWGTNEGGQGLFVVGGAGGLLASPDGEVWTPISGVWGPIGYVSCGGGVFVAMTPFGTVYSSTDGQAWAYAFLDISGEEGDEVTALAYVQGHFLATCEVDQGPQNFASENGTDWVKSATDSSLDRPAALAGNANKIVAVTSENRIQRKLLVAPPTASFTFAPGSPRIGENVVFTDTSAGDPTAWSWNFGDGATSSMQNPSHAFVTAGSHTVALTASNEVGPDTATQTVTAIECTLACSASGNPALGGAPLLVGFTSQITPDGCLAAPAILWDFGDGVSSTEPNPQHGYAAPGVYTWTLTVTADDKTCTRTGTVTVLPCALTCSASVTPGFAAAPVTAAFTSTAASQYCAGPVIRAWSFGDGGTSSEPNPSHTYEQPGSYGWALTVTADDQTCTETGTVEALGPSCAGAYDLMIPAAANSNGVWKSDVDLLNLGTSPASVDIALLKASQANLNPQAINISVPAGQALRIPDILGTLLPASNAALALRFCSGEVFANSRFYNIGTPKTGTFGMAVPAMEPTQAITDTRPGVFHNLSYSPDAKSGYRVNIGFANASPFAVNMIIKLYGDSGELLGTKAFSLRALTQLQWTKIHQIVGTPPVAHGWASVEATTKGAVVLAYAMLIDNLSQDPLSMLPELLPTGLPAVTGAAGEEATLENSTLAVAPCTGPYSLMIPAAANSNKVWKSDVDLLNLGASPASVDIALLKSGEINLNAQVASVEVPSGQTLRIPDILGTLLPASNAALGFRFCSGEAFASSRFFNIGTAKTGTFGMAVPGLPVSQAITPTTIGVFHHMSYSTDPKSGYRVNLGFANASAFPVNVVIKLYGDSGELLGTKPFSVRAYSQLQWTKIHQLLNTPAVTRGYATVEVTTTNARVHAYEMLIDNVSNDPAYFAPDVVQK